MSEGTERAVSEGTELHRVFRLERELLQASLDYAEKRTWERREVLLVAAVAFGAECQRLAQLELLALRATSAD